MAWFLRLKEDAEVYKPRECPDYTDANNFSIKLFHGGIMNENPRNYVGGSVDYVDFCNVDQMSMLEIYGMLNEVGYKGGYFNIWYKAPGTTMDRGLFELQSDDELLLMCAMMPKAKYVEIYSTTIAPLSEVSQPCNLEDCDVEFVDDRQGNMGEDNHGSGGQGRGRPDNGSGASRRQGRESQGVQSIVTFHLNSVRVLKWKRKNWTALESWRE